MADREYSRKVYISKKSYPDFMRETPARAVWNEITVQNPYLAEFSRARKTSFDRSVEDYLRQSERKKPYLEQPYEAMEYDWEGYTPGVLPNFRFDSPAPNIYGIPGFIGVGMTAFSAGVSPCYCSDGPQDISIWGSHPITNITVSEGNISSIVIINPTNWNAVYDGGPASGLVEFIVYMFSTTLDGGTSGYANDSLISCGQWQCEDPCEGSDEIELVTAPETIGRSTSAAVQVSGGVEPLNWSISGSGFTIGTDTDHTNTVYTDAAACGTGTITVTDDCDHSLTFAIRCTFGSWSALSGCPTCVAPGLYTSRDTLIAQWAERIDGGYKSRSYYVSCQNKNPGQCPEDDVGRPNCTPCTDGCDCVDPGSDFCELLIFPSVLQGSWYPCCSSGLSSVRTCESYRDTTVFNWEWTC